MRHGGGGQDARGLLSARRVGPVGAAVRTTELHLELGTGSLEVGN
jgi:hypothetical protein